MGLVQAQHQAEHCGGEEGEADDRASSRAHRSPAQGDGPSAEDCLTDLLCVPLTDEDDASDFDCGVPALNTYFHKRAVSNDRRGLGKTYVLHGSSAGPSVLGFYTLSMADVETATLPRKHRACWSSGGSLLAAGMDHAEGTAEALASRCPLNSAIGLSMQRQTPEDRMSTPEDESKAQAELGQPRGQVACMKKIRLPVDFDSKNPGEAHGTIRRT